MEYSLSESSEDRMALNRHGSSPAVFTDLDGSLLDHDTYEWEPAAEALDRCRRRGVPVIMVSSKTRAEMEVLRRTLRLDWPFVSENGGGITFPSSCPQQPPAEAVLDGEDHIWALGDRYENLVRILGEIRDELGWNTLRGFFDMGLEEIGLHTGLSEQDAVLAVQREYDEPFIVEEREERDMELLVRAAEKRGARVTVGGRFFHLFGSCDKGVAVNRLTAWLRTERSGLRTLGLGDSPNDLPMLREVDVPVLIRSASPAVDLVEAVPGIRVTEETGPAGWNLAVLDFLEDCVNGGEF